MEDSTTAITNFLTEKEVAAILRLSVKTLRNYRQAKNGPPYVKLGAAVRYPQCKLEQWINKCPVYCQN